MPTHNYYSANSHFSNRRRQVKEENLPPTAFMSNNSNARSKVGEPSAVLLTSTPPKQSRKSLPTSFPHWQDLEDSRYSDFEQSNSKVRSVLIPPPPRPTTRPGQPKLSRKARDSYCESRNDCTTLSKKNPISGSVVYLPPDVDIIVRKKCGSCESKAVLNASQIAALQGDEEVVVYCGTHLKSSSKPDGTGLLPDYLSLQARIILTEKMHQPISKTDGPGFIYIYEPLDSPDNEKVKLSVGIVSRASQKERESEWIQSCGAKAIERYLYPEGLNGGIPRKQSDYRAPLKWCRRVEELVRIELVDLMQSRAYLDPYYPRCPYNVKRETDDATKYFTTCKSCGKRHHDVYQFERLDGGQEWEVITKPIIQKWARFVNRGRDYDGLDLDQ